MALEPCGSWYVTDTIVGGVAECSFANGHDRVMNPVGMNRTLFDHGNQRYGIWWNEDSSFHNASPTVLVEVKGCTAQHPDKTMYCGFDEGHPPILGPAVMKPGVETFYSHGNKKHDVWWNVDTDWSHNVNARVEMDSVGVTTYDVEGGRTFTTAPVSTLKVEQIEDPPQPDMVNHPPHYGGESNLYEAIKVIEAWELGFCLGNAVKYISRADRKGNRLQDLQKAQWYLEREIARTVADPELLG